MLLFRLTYALISLSSFSLRLQSATLRHYSLLSPTNPELRMGDHFDSTSAFEPFKVLVLGGCYGGLSAALNLIDLAEGRAARQGSGVAPGHNGKIPVEITVVDERDGYCMFFHFSFLSKFCVLASGRSGNM